MNKIDMTITPLKIFERNELQLTLVKNSNSRRMLWHFMYSKIVGHMRRVKC